MQKIVSRCDGKIIIIDTGMSSLEVAARSNSDHVAGISHAYGGALSALSVEYSLTPAANDASGEKKWTETETVKALYLDREVVLAEDQREVVGNFD